ncbi:MAG: response regulator [Deltaproteobacteria bacterium]|nr:response regulator [Deltaproteobacteria bacterium]
MEAKKPKILVVDDESDLVYLMEQRLVSYGFEVETACDGEESLKKTQTFRPDAIFLDVVMPGMSGWETCRKLRAMPETKSVLIVILTATQPSEVEKEIKASGADCSLIKPVDDDELIAMLSKITPARTEQSCL